MRVPSCSVALTLFLSLAGSCRANPDETRDRGNLESFLGDESRFLLDGGNDTAKNLGEEPDDPAHNSGDVEPTDERKAEADVRPTSHWGVRVSAFVPTRAKVEKLDAFWGGGIYVRSGQQLFLQFSFDFYYGKGRVEYSDAQGRERTDTFTDLVFQGMVGIGIALPFGPDKNGDSEAKDPFYARHGALLFTGCVGIAYEYVPRNDYGDSQSGVAFPIDIRIGYVIAPFEVSTGVQFLPGSDNVTAVWILSVGLVF